MKVAVVLVSSVFLLSAPVVHAQSADPAAQGRSGSAGLEKVARNGASSQTRGNEDTDRAIDAELKRVSHIANICTGC